MKKSDADKFVKETNRDPRANLFYHPTVLRNTIAGAVIGGMALGIMTWLVVKGIIPIEGLTQETATGPGMVALLSFIAGSALGGLIGSVYGIFMMLNKRA